MVEVVQVLATAGTIGTGIGIATTVYYHQQTRRMLEEKNRVRWDDLRDEARALNTRIGDEFDPDVIVTPGMRGATVANLMRGVYESVLLYIGVREDVRDGAVGLEHRPTNYVPLEETTKYRHYVPAAITEETDKKVLVLDAFTDTGQSLMTFENYLHDQGFPPERVKRATVYCSENAIEDGNQPHFYGQEVSRPFYFPWGKAV